MARKKLTTRGITSLKPRAERYHVFDIETRGLAVRVTPQGSKSWVYYYRIGGKLKMLTLGPLSPKLGLAEARRRAIDARANVNDHVDPATEKAEAKLDARSTVNKLVTLYKADPRVTSKRSWTEEARVLDKDVCPAWGDRALKDISRADVRELVNAKLATGKAVMANRLLAHVSHLFNYALDLELVDANPAARFKKVHTPTRERVLAREEWTALWAYVLKGTLPQGGTEPGWSAIMRDLFAMLLLTGQRLGEVARMRWADVDLGQRWWTLPAAATKNGLAHRVPLAPAAVELLTRLRPEKDDDVARQVYVFSTIAGANIYDRAKKAMAVLCRTFRPPKKDDPADATGIWRNVRAHDIRRTVATNLGELGVAPHIISAILNHTDGSITAVYNRFRYDLEKREALERWAMRLTQVKAPADVTNIDQRKRR